MLNTQYKNMRFKDNILESKSPEEIRNEFMQKGVNIPQEYVESVVNKIKSELEKPTEISDDALDTVSGGASSWLKNNWGKILTAIGVVTATGITIGLVRHYSGKTEDKLKDTKKEAKALNGQISEVNNAIGDATNAMDNLK